jgi:hypothetical protein
MLSEVTLLFATLLNTNSNLHMLQAKIDMNHSCNACIYEQYLQNSELISADTFYGDFNQLFLDNQSNQILSIDNSTVDSGDPVFYNQQEYFSELYYDNSLTYKTIPFYRYFEFTKRSSSYTIPTEQTPYFLYSDILRYYDYYYSDDVLDTTFDRSFYANEHLWYTDYKYEDSLVNFIVQKAIDNELEYLSQNSPISHDLYFYYLGSMLFEEFGYTEAIYPGIDNGTSFFSHEVTLGDPNDPPVHYRENSSYPNYVQYDSIDDLVIDMIDNKNFVMARGKYSYEDQLFASAYLILGYCTKWDNTYYLAYHPSYGLIAGLTSDNFYNGIGIALNVPHVHSDNIINDSNEFKCGCGLIIQHKDHYYESYTNVDEDYHSAICEDCGQTTLHLHDSYLEFVNNTSHAIVCEHCNLRQIKPHFKGNPAICPCRFVHV